MTAILMDREDLEYICEIAYYIWGLDTSDTNNKILDKFYVDFDYNERVDFYRYVLKWCELLDEKVSLLETIYHELDNNYGRMLELFLTGKYKRKWAN